MKKTVIIDDEFEEYIALIEHVLESENYQCIVLSIEDVEAFARQKKVYAIVCRERRATKIQLNLLVEKLHHLKQQPHGQEIHIFIHSVFPDHMMFPEIWESQSYKIHYLYRTQLPFDLLKMLNFIVNEKDPE